MYLSHRNNIVILSFVTSLLLACSLFQRSRAEMNFLLPTETDAPGWELVKQSLQNRFDPASGIEYEASVSAIYRSYRKKSIKIEAEILKFHEPVDAYGLYSRERGYGENRVKYNDRIYLTEKWASVCRGRFYSRVKYINEIGKERALLTFINVISKKIRAIADRWEMPAYLHIFAKKNNITGNVVYYKKGLREIPELERVYVIRGEGKMDNRHLFIKRFNSVYSSLMAYNRILKSRGKSAVLQKAGDILTIFFLKMRNSYIFVAHKEGWIFGVLDSTGIEDGSEIVGDMADRLTVYNKKL